MRIGWVLFFILVGFTTIAQQGTLTGTAVDDKGKALENATVQLISFNDSLSKYTSLTDKTGSFTGIG